MFRLLPLFLALFLTACAAQPVEKSPEQLVREAEDLTSRRIYEEAVAAWERVRDGFFSPELTALAEMKIADTHFLAENFLEAAVAYEEFLKPRPTHPEKARILYQLGTAYFRQMLASDRDQTATRNTLAVYQRLVAEFPQDPRRAEVLSRIDLCRNHLASHELYVGRFYLRSHKPTAAISRFNYLLQKYPDFSDLDQVYFYLAQAQLQAGNPREAEAIYRLLTERYPQSKFTAQAEKLLSRVK